ncbi:MAG TPA: type III pantothenate kinase [Opitutaceae bacterium]|nr:type III pantothenate kinase [Opitutaceae bacterium]
MSLLCIDIGNTHTHYGVVATGATVFQRALPTRLLDDARDGLGPALAQILAGHPAIEGAAFCSVVPAATEKLSPLLAALKLPRPVFQLTYEKKLGVRIGYPRPKEIGADRLANAAGAHALFGSPAIVIDLGTAVTFDIITQSRGYEGGIIAPGVEVMRRYLHEQTALLPVLDDSLEVTRAIGQSTVEAMRIGTVVGFGGMIQALLDAVLAELAPRGEPLPRVLATGSSAALLDKTLRHPFTPVPDLTLRGLAAAWQLNIS